MLNIYLPTASAIAERRWDGLLLPVPSIRRCHAVYMQPAAAAAYKASKHRKRRAFPTTARARDGVIVGRCTIGSGFRKCTSNWRVLLSPESRQSGRPHYDTQEGTLPPPHHGSAASCKGVGVVWISVLKSWRCMNLGSTSMGERQLRRIGRWVLAGQAQSFPYCNGVLVLPSYLRLPEAAGWWCSRACVVHCTATDNVVTSQLWPGMHFSSLIEESPTCSCAARLPSSHRFLWQTLLNINGLWLDVP